MVHHSPCRGVAAQVPALDHPQVLERCVIVSVVLELHPHSLIQYHFKLTVMLVCLLLVNQHPSPVYDCPYFEDAIAFESIILSQVLGHDFLAYATAV